MHDNHQALPNYHPGQILFDGCAECKERAMNPYSAIAHMDEDTFTRAWKRAFDAWHSDGAGVSWMSDNENRILRVLWVVQLQLARRGMPNDGEIPNFFARPKDNATLQELEARATELRERWNAAGTTAERLVLAEQAAKVMESIERLDHGDTPAHR